MSFVQKAQVLCNQIYPAEETRQMKLPLGNCKEESEEGTVEQENWLRKVAILLHGSAIISFLRVGYNIN